MWVEQIDVDAKLLIKLDSGFPNLGEFAIPAEALAPPGDDAPLPGWLISSFVMSGTVVLLGVCLVANGPLSVPV